MNKVDHLLKETSSVSSGQSRVDDRLIDVTQLWVIMRRQTSIMLLCLMIAAGLGFFYLRSTPPVFRSEAQILLDEDLNRLADQVTAMPVNIQTDSQILSQIEILKSTRLARKVAEQLNLETNPAFTDPPLSLLNRTTNSVRAFLRSARNSILGTPPKVSAGEGDSPDDENPSVTDILRGTLEVERSGRSFVISIGYPSTDAALSNSIVRAYTAAYIEDQLNAKFDAAQQAATWLEGRVNQLAEAQREAALAVEEYRRQNGLSVVKGELVSDQRLGELTNQLVVAQTETGRAKALSEQIDQVLAAGVDSAVQNAMIVPQDGRNTVIVDLRQKYATVIRREQDVIGRYGASHPQAIALRQEREDIGRQIFGEIQRIAETYRNDLKVAEAREASLRQTVGEETTVSSGAGQSLVRLRELEQRSKTLTALHDSFMSKYEETIQQQNFPVGNKRVLSEADMPVAPISPRFTSTMALALVLGLVCGCGFGALNEFNERFFRVGEQIRRELDLKFLGYLPRLSGRRRVRRWPFTSRRGRSQSNQPTRETLRVAERTPHSPYTEVLRGTKIACDVILQNSSSKVIAFLSILPNEGKSTTAANFAGLLSAGGAKTLLIDADLRKPGLTRLLAPFARGGLIEASLGTPWQEIVQHDEETGLTLIPAISTGNFAHSDELLTSRGMQKLIQELRREFTYIVVDLPPLGPVVDAKAAQSLVDGFILVTEWGRTPRALVRSLLETEPQLNDKIIGAILNNTDLDKLPRYGSIDGEERFLDLYSSYTDNLFK